MSIASIRFFTHEECINCKIAKKLLYKILSDSEISYSAHVLELNIKNPNALTELLMLNTQQVPTIVIGDTILTGEGAIDEEKLRLIVTSNLKG